MKGREEILKVHAKKVKMAKEVDLAVIAKSTPGFVGADLANVINEAAILAARQDKPAVTNADIEGYFRTGRDPRIDNPERIGIVHCVGSRDEKAGCRNCSKVCCATAVRQACELKAKFPKAKVYCFYMDLRMFGRGYEDLYLKAQKEYGVRFIRGRVSEVSEKIDKTLQVKAEDTLSSTPLKVSLDLLVLMAGMRPSKAGTKVAKMIRLDTGEDGYLSVADGFTGMQATSIPGLFVAGAATGPKTLPETLAEARAASALIHDYLKG